METRNLLQPEQQNTYDDDQDEEHPFLTTRPPVSKHSLASSPSCKKGLLFSVSLLMALFIGYIIANTAALDNAEQRVEIAAIFTSNATTLSPTSTTPSHIALSPQTSSPTHTPTIKPTIKPTPDPTSKPTKKPIKKQKPTKKPSSNPTKNPTKHPTAITNITANATTKTTKHITNKTPTQSPTLNPTSSPSKPVNIMKETVLSGSMNKNVLFQSSALSTNLDDSELTNLLVNIDVITVNEVDGLSMHQLDAFNGAYAFNYKYPKDPNDEYTVNELRRTCYNFEFKSISSMKNVLIEVKFKRFMLENGFDRVLIRHFNESFIDLPQSYSGYHQDLTIYYLLEKGTAKTVCIEFQSDDTITNNGIDYDVTVRYDSCIWSDWSGCYMIPLWGKKWTRGPFMNGKCGLGITSRYRMGGRNGVKVDVSDGHYEGFVADCGKEDMIHEYGPEYCIKRNCEDWNNYNDTEFDPEQVPGQGWFNISRYYNGVGRLDPKYPDPFRMYLSTKDVYDVKRDGWFEKLNMNLMMKIDEIVNEHQDVNILEYAMVDPYHRDKTTEYLGAKVLDSLINGKPFITALTGDSVTSGHDNMFMSTYPMQLQSRLRKWWTEIGNKGAAFLTRNYGTGGGPSSDSIGFMPRSMVTETFPDPFSKLSKILDDNYDIWYRNGYPIRKIDIETFEFHFVEGNGRHSTRELHLRESASLGAIWAVIQPISGVSKVSDSCKKWEDINTTLFNDWNWDQLDRGHYMFLNDEYFDKMGIAAFDPDYGMSASCPLYKEGTEKLEDTGGNAKGDDGERPDGQMYAYTNWWLKVNWHPNSRGHRIMSDMLSYWIMHSATSFMHKYKDVLENIKDITALQQFLEEKSGNWRSNLLQSVIDQKYDEFVVPTYCGRDSIDMNMSSKEIEYTQYNNYCSSLPFALTNTRPSIYNTHNALNEYVYLEQMDDDWAKYIENAGWQWSTTNNIISIDLKKGAEGNMDTFWNLKPKVSMFMDAFDEYKGQDDNDDYVDILDGFHQYLIGNNIYLQFMVKTPKFGSGSIKIFNGFHCDEWMESINLVKVYVNTLENIANKTDDLGQMMKSNDCIMRGLELNTKYIVSYVPYNITAKRESKGKDGFAEYFIMFLMAF